jgi:hypothetical protein
VTTPLTSQQLDEIDEAIAAYGKHPDIGFACCSAHPAAEHAAALLAEVRALRSERDELRGKFADAAASLAEQVLRYGQRQREHNADREELERLRGALTQIWRLHKDSPMGPCPVCIDADAAAAGGDGLVGYPCPTARLAGAQDCDPPSFRTATA